MLVLTQLQSETRRLYGLLLLGIVIREAFSFWTGHPWDFEVWIRVGYYTSKGVNPYGLLDPVPGLSLSGAGTMTSIGYPPFWAFITAFLYDLYSLFGGNRFVYYFLLKQPLILGDLAVGYLLFRIAKLWGGTDALSLTRFWMLCPFVIVVSSIWGMFDGLTIAFMLAALVAFGQTYKSASLIGIGAYLKGIPLVFAPVISAARDIRHSLKFLLVALGIPITLSIAPFVILRWDPTGFLLMARSQSSRPVEGMTLWSMFRYFPSVFAGGFFGALLSVASVMWIPALLVTYAALLARRQKSQDQPQWMISSMIVVMSVFLITRLYVPEQYALYLIAFLLLDTHLWHPERKALLDATWIAAMIFLLVNNPLLIRFASPISHWAYDWDIAINNTPPTATIRYTVMFVVACAFFLTMIQVLKTYYGNTKVPIEPWVFGYVRRAYKSPTVVWYLAYLLFFIGASLSLDIVVIEMISDWRVALDQPILFGLNRLGLYHLSFVLLVLGFNAFISSARSGSLLIKTKTFLNLFGLYAASVGINLILYSLVRGQIALSNRPILLVWQQLNENTFFMICILLGLSTLLVSQHLEVLARVLHRLSQNQFDPREVSD